MLPTEDFTVYVKLMKCEPITINYFHKSLKPLSIYLNGLNSI